jgi:hypothetical protein
MSISAISPATCGAIARRPIVNVLVERLARRLLAWSQRAPRDRAQLDDRLTNRLANERAIATSRQVRWY